jgi:hypothetical protein
MKSSPYLFFIKNAGYSYDPKKETPFKGRVRCARALAEAEKRASAEGCSFEWEQDDSTNREWTDEGAEYYTWRCLMRDSVNLGTILTGAWWRLRLLLRRCPSLPIPESSGRVRGSSGWGVCSGPDKR